MTYLNHTPIISRRRVLTTIAAALATLGLAASSASAGSVLDTGQFEHEWLKGSPDTTQAMTRPFWPATFDTVLAVSSPLDRNTGQGVSA
jgi:hypothetical protein